LDAFSRSVARTGASRYGPRMAKATTLEAAIKVLDPRPLDFSPHTDGAPEATNPKFYAHVPEAKGPDGFKLLAPLDRMRDRLLQGTRETKLFLSGHVGSGKSTELSRFMANAEIRERFDVVSLVLEEHEHATLDSAQLLFRLGAALYEAHKERLAKATGWKKKLDVLNERVFGPMGVQAKEGSIGLEFDLVIFKLKQDLKFSEAKRKQFREYGETERTVLQDFIKELVEDIEEALDEEQKPAELLVVVDDLDKLRTAEQHKDIFDTNLSAILAPPLRIVYTCPTAVRFGVPRAEIRQNGEDLFPVRVLERVPDSWDPEAAYTPERIAFFHAVVNRRIKEGLVEPEAIRLAAIYSGGVLRDFFRLLREGVLLALYNERDVLDGIAMKYAVAEERRRESIGLYTPDYEALIHIHRTNGLPDANDRRYLTLARVIECFNGTVWFEAAPILWYVLEDHEKRVHARDPGKP
jgi:KAP family P-loop domain